MAAARCSQCGISYPGSFRSCQFCDGDLAYLSDAKPDSDWRTQVDRLQTQVVSDEEHEGIVAWRREQLAGAGYCQEQADAIAGRFDVDLHTAVGLLRQGCAMKTALRILL